MRDNLIEAHEDPNISFLIDRQLSHVKVHTKILQIRMCALANYRANFDMLISKVQEHC